ncbi:MAG: hypothetical protein J5841_07630 [Clostridia bacterium]|nr:hypothetical protein [Clostridia bacterium]
MKRTLFILFTLCVCLLLCVSCAGQSTAPADPNPNPNLSTNLTPDLDLSKMSSTVVYAEINNIQYDPTQYLGKVIRLRGLYAFHREPSTDMVYYACVVPDATACCMQGMEFVPAAEPQDPDRFLEDSADITVTGRLEIYVEENTSYLHLVDAQVELNS